MIFVDLRKVFNTIDHKILIEEMTCMDFSNDATKWFKCYLSRECLMYINAENSFSNKALINFGAPQGSMILGPLLFLLYFNEWCRL